MGILTGATWAVVLIKDFDVAKERLSPALTPRNRRNLAVSCAVKALASAINHGPRLKYSLTCQNPFDAVTPGTIEQHG